MPDSLVMIPAWIDGQLQPVEKLEAHRRGLKHLAVSVFLVSGEKVLLQKRALTKYHTPGLWANTVCTHPFVGEQARNCAHRRLHDELGITGVEVSYCQTVEYRADVGGGLTEHEVVDIFVGQTRADIKVSPNPAEVADIRWVSFDDLAKEIAETPEVFTPWLRIYMAKHRAAIEAA